jgi:hypothetical protein
MVPKQKAKSVRIAAKKPWYTRKVASSVRTAALPVADNSGITQSFIYIPSPFFIPS